MGTVEMWGAEVDMAVDYFVALLREHPRNFKDLTDLLMVPPKNGNEHTFYLSMLAATALIRLAEKVPS